MVPAATSSRWHREAITLAATIPEPVEVPNVPEDVLRSNRSNLLSDYSALDER